jgi:hypothetical protein
VDSGQAGVDSGPDRIRQVSEAGNIKKYQEISGSLMNWIEISGNIRKVQEI